MAHIEEGTTTMQATAPTKRSGFDRINVVAAAGIAAAFVAGIVTG